MGETIDAGKPSLRPRIFFADDHAMVVQGLCALLEKNYDILGVVADGRALVAEAPKLHPDVVVVDVGMPFLNGLDAVERLIAVLPDTKFVFLTMQDDPQSCGSCTEFGSFGIIDSVFLG
jgi:DNA-binding NarL/FixJ family response regulator